MNIRPAKLQDVPAIRELINTYAELGLMLFRSLAELYENLRDFLVCEEAGQVVGCCALQIYWADLGEIKSLAVREDRRGRGIGSALVGAALAQAEDLGLPRVFVLTYEVRFFERLGFARVDRHDLPMKVWSDCVRCPRQGQCDERALVRHLREAEARRPISP